MLKAYRCRPNRRPNYCSEAPVRGGSVCLQLGARDSDHDISNPKEGHTRCQLDKPLTALKQELPWLQDVVATSSNSPWGTWIKRSGGSFTTQMDIPASSRNAASRSGTYPRGIKIHWDNSVFYVSKAGWGPGSL